MSEYVYLGYIKTDDIVKYCQKMSKDYELTNPSYSDACGDIENKCLDLSNRDITVVKHGEWIEKRDKYGGFYYVCSNCKNDRALSKSNFCCDCGADMRGETK